MDVQRRARWIRVARGTAALAVALTFPAGLGTLNAETQFAVGRLNLPRVTATERCPVTKGSLAIVAPAPHIFGSGGVWFGAGPVYVNLAWKSDRLPPARFSFHEIPIYEGKPWPAKTPVVADPSYTGPIVIRGQALRGERAALLFGGSDGPVERLELDAPHGRPSPGDWSFWATGGMIVPAAGCYGVQIDTARRSEVVIFEATP
jgi:hypothetical protein